MGSQMKDGEDSGPQILGFILNFKFQNKIEKYIQKPFEIIKVQFQRCQKCAETKH